MEENINVAMSVNDAIIYYANKIIEDSLAQCIELNYCLPIEYYNDNGFVKYHQKDILEQIRKDERVADVELDKTCKPNCFDMVFFSDYCPNYYEDCDLSKKDQANVLKKFVNLLININKNSDFSLKTNTQKIINNFLLLNHDVFLSDEKEDINNFLKDCISQTSFFGDNLNKYKVIVNNDNIRNLIVELQEKVHSLNECQNEIEQEGEQL